MIGKEAALKHRVVLAGTLAILACASGARAQISAPAINRDVDFHNSIGAGASVGSPYQRDAYFWGLTVDYNRVIHLPWSVSASIAFDQEHEQPEAGPKAVVNSFTFVLTISWSAARWVTLTTGLGKGFLDDDNAANTLEFTSGDWGTGLAVGLSLPDLPFTPRDAFTLSAAWEWNITKSEPIVSTDLGFSWSF
jgi:hypothetical protein